MVEGQKKRQVGKGMKPRGNKRFTDKKETKKVTDQSTNEGQAQGAPEPVSSHQDGNETPGNLEPENSSELSQNLEENEAIVAHDEGSELSDVRVFSDSSELEAALKESGSGPISDEEALKRGIVVERDSAGIISSAHPVSVSPFYLETAMEVGTGTGKDVQPPCGGVPMGQTMQPAIIYEASGGKEGIARVGLQPDGTTKVVVTIQEGYWSAVTQWSEADGVPVEQWLSDRLYEYVSTYGEPAKGR